MSRLPPSRSHGGIIMRGNGPEFEHAWEPPEPPPGEPEVVTNTSDEADQPPEEDPPT